MAFEGTRFYNSKVKNEGQIAAVGSIGLVNFWDPSSGFANLNGYLETTESFAKCGACIGIGLCSTGIYDENHPAKAMLFEALKGGDDSKLGAIIGLGFAYAGTNNTDIQEELVPIIIDTSLNQDLSAFAALSLGLIFVGQANDEIATAII